MFYFIGKEKMNVSSSDDLKLDKNSSSEVITRDSKDKEEMQDNMDVKKRQIAKGKKISDKNTSEYFDTTKKTMRNRKRLATSESKPDSLPVKPIKEKQSGKKSSKNEVIKRSKLNISTDNIEHSDSDFETTSSQFSSVKLEKMNIDSSSSESDFEDVEEVEASTSGYNSKLLTSSTSENNSKLAADFSQVDHQNFDINMLAKIEGVELQKQMDSDDSDDDSDWEKVEGICGVHFTYLCSEMSQI